MRAWDAAADGITGTGLSLCIFQAKASAAVSGAPIEKPIMLIKARDEGGKLGTTPDAAAAAAPVSGSGVAKLEREGQRPTQPVYQIQNRGMASSASSSAVDRELLSVTNSHSPRGFFFRHRLVFLLIFVFSCMSHYTLCY